MITTQPKGAKQSEVKLSYGPRSAVQQVADQRCSAWTERSSAAARDAQIDGAHGALPYSSIFNDTLELYFWFTPHMHGVYTGLAGHGFHKRGQKGIRPWD